jgi:hypothetical protein
MAEIKDFTSSHIEDLKALGFVWTSERIMKDVVFDFLTRGDVQLFFQKGQLMEIRVGTRTNVTDMGRDNLSNKKLRDAFVAIDNSYNVLNAGPGVSPEEMGNFKYWKADMQLDLNIPYLFHGESKESTPFYTQIYPDIVKLTQISDIYKNFNELSFKDQLKQIGKEFKGAIFPKKGGGAPINETENLNQAEKEVKTLSTDFFETKPDSEKGKSPINPTETESEEITKSSETIETKGPAVESQVLPSDISASETTINSPSDIKSEDSGSQSGTINNITYNTSTVNETVINQNNTQNNIDDSKEINTSEVTNVSQPSSGGSTVINPVNPAAEIIEDAAPILNETTENISSNIVDEIFGKKTMTVAESESNLEQILQLARSSTEEKSAINSDQVTEDIVSNVSNKIVEDTTVINEKESREPVISTPISSTQNNNNNNINSSNSESNTSEINNTTDKLEEVSNNLESYTNTVEELNKNTTTVTKSLTDADANAISLNDFGNAEDLQMINSYFGKETVLNSSMSTESNNVSTDKNDKSTEILKESDNLEVNKNPVGLDKKVAPINTFNNTSTNTNSASQDSNEELKNETNNEVNPVNNQVTETLVSNNVANQTTNEGSQTAMTNSSVGGNYVDLSEVSMRLRRLEDLLMGPLEVKVIN